MKTMNGFPSTVNWKGWATLLPLAIALAACGDDDDNGGTPDVGSPDTVEDSGDTDTPDNTDTTPLPDVPPDVEPDGDVPPDVDAAEELDGDDDVEVVDPDPAPPADCDPLVPTLCALPWPSNLYLLDDDTTETGYRVTFGPTTLPANRRRQAFDTTQFRRFDGYSVGTPLIVEFPGVDITGFPGEYDSLMDSVGADANVLWFRVTEAGAERVPHWVELDSRANVAGEQLLFVQPAVILEEGAHYVVAFRNLVDTTGAPIPRSEAFQALVDGNTAADPALAGRQARFNQTFAFLADQGVELDDVVLAWDFHTATSSTIHGTMLSIRDQAYDLVGEAGPTLRILEVIENDIEGPDATISESGNMDGQIWLDIRAQVTVPDFNLRIPVNSSLSGWDFAYDEEGNVVQQGERVVDFSIFVPAAASGGEPMGLVQYGHGLLGGHGEFRRNYNRWMANEYGLIFFASDLTGMSGADVPVVLAILGNLGNFHWLSDRIHQGYLEWLLIARAVREQLGDMPEITSRGVVVNQEELFYTGISQGGIYGASYLALSPEITRGHFGVPGQNYFKLLYRSVDFDGYFLLMANSYPNRREQGVILAAVQMVWDQVDPISYMRHITHEPFAGNPVSHGIWAPAKADWQVYVGTNEIAARSGIDIALMENYDRERVVAGVDETGYPHTGSAVVLYDFGNPWPAENVNVPPNDAVGDPHEDPRQTVGHNRQMVHFFRTGEVIDVCEGAPCYFGPPLSEGSGE